MGTKILSRFDLFDTKNVLGLAAASTVTAEEVGGEEERAEATLLS